MRQSRSHVAGPPGGGPAAPGSPVELAARVVLASWGLLPAPPDPGAVSAALRDPEAFPRLIAAHRLALPLADAIAAGAPVDLPAANLAWLRRRAGVLRRQNQRCAATAVAVADALAQAGVPALFVKGMFQASLVLHDPMARHTSDVDVLVSPSDLPRAEAALVHAGAVAAARPDPRLARANRHITHASTLTWSGVPIDLHHRLDPMPGMLDLPFPALWDQRAHVEVSGRILPTLGPRDTLLLVACHGGRDGWATMRAVLDLIAAFRTGGADPEALWARAHASGAAGRLAVALAVGRHLAPGLPPQRPYPTLLGTWAWNQLPGGLADRQDPGAGRMVGTYLFAVASAQSAAAIPYALRRLAWQPSATHAGALPPRWSWAYPLLAPWFVAARVLRRPVPRTRAGITGTPAGGARADR